MTIFLWLACGYSVVFVGVRSLTSLGLGRGDTSKAWEVAKVVWG